MPGPVLMFTRAPATGPTTIEGVVKALSSGVPQALITVDMTKTVIPPNPIDNSFGAKIFFAVECTDGTDVQIRSGDVNANVALKLPATYVTSQAQNASNALTGGNLTVAFTWTTSGNTATLQVTATTTLALPTQFKITYFVLYATHNAFQYA